MSDIDKYIGRRVRYHRQRMGYSIESFAQHLFISLREQMLSETGQRRYLASELFDLNRQFDVPLGEFFSRQGEYLSDVIADGSELAGLIHYFGHIECRAQKREILKMIKDASTVF